MDALVKLAKDAVKAGAASSEAYFYRGDILELTVLDGDLVHLTRAAEQGAALRMIVNKKLGFAATNDTTSEGLKSLIDRALTFTQLQRESPFPSFPKKLAQYRDLRIFDPQATQISPKQRLELAERAERYAMGFDARIQRSGASVFRDVLEETIIANGTGLVARQAATRFQLRVTVNAVDAGALLEGSSQCTRRLFSDLELPELVGRRAALQALWLVNSESVVPGRYPIVFDPHQAGPAFWRWTIGRALASPNLSKDSTSWFTKLNTEVAAKAVTLYDNPALAGGNCSAPFDAEGVETAAVRLIENGNLKNFLHDLGSAARCEQKANGCARRLTYRSQPQGMPSNLFLAAGNQGSDAIIATVSEGFYVVKLHEIAIDPATDRFAASAQGRWIKNGEFAHSIRNAAIYGTITELLKGVDAVGDDLHYNNYYDDLAVSCPTFRIGSAEIQEL